MRTLNAYIHYQAKGLNFSPKKLNHLWGLLALTTLAFTSCNDTTETIPVQQQEIIEAVYASGYLVPDEEYQLFAQTEGVVAQKLVEEGAEVKAGDPVYILGSSQQDARFTETQERYRLAQLNLSENSPVLQELRAGVQAAKTKLAYDSVNYHRYKNLIEAGATSPAEWDRMRLAYENSQSEYRAQQSRLQRTINQLQQELTSARSQLNIASDESGRYIVRSDRDGKVYYTAKRVGELVKRNELLATLGKSEQFHLELQIDELDIRKISLGQEVLTELDAFPGQLFRARVSKIYPQVSAREQAVRVEATFTDSLPAGFSGLSAEGNIIIARKQNALVIPKEALVSEDSVWIRQEGEERKIRIQKGIETLDRVEVLAGLDAQTQLLMK
ncbi:efflux RND transporter periplasmic adaptor subunit [Cesiribacter sp. SM1]|uniref:efflux RND transporter periplasmic adaptor subunit n=1 Tax=Cesiribacter sp. SM1 TaxID=2861196 RepID=UPI001CD749BB|nr:efflux RND transporter periplasmic adaptor subunit [Cesiribacter sp. SM1]